MFRLVGHPDIKGNREHVVRRTGASWPRALCSFLLSHCAQAHNRYQIQPGSAMTPEQRSLRTMKQPRAIYVWGASILATPPPSLRQFITGRYGQAAYLGPEVAGGSHLVQFRLKDGSLKIARSARIRMLVPMTFELSALRGICRMLPERAGDVVRGLPAVDQGNMRDLPIPNTETRGPPASWVEENGRTPRCRACRLRGVPADKAWHTQKCRDRYAAYVKSSFDPNQFVLDDAQHELEIEGVELDLGSRAFGELDVGLELPDDVQDYEPTEDEGERGLGESFLPEGVLEGELRPGDSVGVEPASSEEADFMEVEPESLDRVPEPESDAMVNNVLFRESLGFAAVANPSTGGQTVKLGGETLVVEMPSSSKDDVTGHALDLGLTYEGMLRELSALESLAVGDVIWHVDPKQKVISTRWVSNAKLERIDGQERPLVRCRVVARDFAQGATAAQLGISAATSSAEALRTFLFYAGSKRQNVVGLDVSTAFLFAELEEDGTVVVRLPAGVTGPNGRPGFMRLRKALYGLRAAAQTWARHLAKLLKRLCDLTPCETEPCLFSGVVLDGQRVAVLCYVDDLLISSDSDEAIYYVVEKLKSAVKIKVTADLDRDQQITFLGRQITRKKGEDSLVIGMAGEYYQEIYEGFGLGKSPKSCPTPPNLRELYDREEGVLERELSSEAAARYRSTLGRLSWLAMTRVDLAYYVSMLARGQASPREKHERAMRMVLRYLRHVQDFRQIVHPVDERSLRLDCYVDASWGSERSVDRKSVSGGCIMLGGFCLKAWSRLQQAVALSSAESELYGLVEGAKPLLQRNHFQSEEQFPTCLDGRSCAHRTSFATPRPPSPSVGLTA